MLCFYKENTESTTTEAHPLKVVSQSHLIHSSHMEGQRRSNKNEQHLSLKTCAKSCNQNLNNNTCAQFGASQQAHDVKMTSDRRRCGDVMTSHRRRYDVILTSCARWVEPILVTFLYCVIIGFQVCGENGISYENECMLRKENCENNKRVKVEHRGLCSKYLL